MLGWAEKYIFTEKKVYLATVIRYTLRYATCRQVDQTRQLLAKMQRKCRAYNCYFLWEWCPSIRIPSAHFLRPASNNKSNLFFLVISVFLAVSEVQSHPSPAAAAHSSPQEKL